MTGEEFGAIAEGSTLHFRDARGEYFGSEQFFKDGRTIWLPRGGTCSRGIWAEDRGRICFLYATELSCWRLYADAETGLYAESANDAAPDAPETPNAEPEVPHTEDQNRVTQLWLMRRDQVPLSCENGPGV